jgi:hypothetical protein
MNTALGRIEESTRRVDIATTQNGNFNILLNTGFAREYLGTLVKHYDEFVMPWLNETRSGITTLVRWSNEFVIPLLRQIAVGVTGQPAASNPARLTASAAPAMSTANLAVVGMSGGSATIVHQHFYGTFVNDEQYSSHIADMGVRKIRNSGNMRF